MTATLCMEGCGRMIDPEADGDWLQDCDGRGYMCLSDCWELTPVPTAAPAGGDR